MKTPLLFHIFRRRRKVKICKCDVGKKNSYAKFPLNCSIKAADPVVHYSRWECTERCYPSITEKKIICISSTELRMIMLQRLSVCTDIGFPTGSCNISRFLSVWINNCVRRDPSLLFDKIQVVLTNLTYV